MNLTETAQESMFAKIPCTNKENLAKDLRPKFNINSTLASKIGEFSMKLAIKSLLAVLFLTGNLYAKDLTNRLGFGFSDQFYVSLPSVMAMYYPNPETGLSAALGVDTTDKESKFGLSFKYYKMIFPEDNMNFYMGGGFSLISSENNGKSNSGYELTGFIGAEYFLQGLDSLSFRMEAGLGIVSNDDGVIFRTIGHHPLKAGMIFYF